MAIEQVVEPVAGEREEYAGVLRFYELAKRQEWQVRDLPWNDAPPIPEGKGSAERKARRRDMWRSVLTQQLQADMLACEMASQLLNIAPEPEAKLYYSTMVQDESRHTEAWLKLIEEAGGTAERDPHLDELAHMTLEADTLEEKVFQMQVFYERLIISRFRLIARSSRGTVLEDLCNRLTTDDGIHHGAGMAYEKVLLQNASKQTKQKLVDAANRLLPTFVEHALWRPKERAFIGRAMHTRDIERLKEDLEIGVRLAESLGQPDADLKVFLEALDVARVHRAADEGTLLGAPERVLDEGRQQPVRGVDQLLFRLLGGVLEQHLLVRHPRAVVDAVVRGQPVAEVLEHGAARRACDQAEARDDQAFVENLHLKDLFL